MYMRCNSIKKQKGAVLALFSVAMLFLVVVAGLALDLSHAYLDKTRLQNLVDAAALSGAYTLLNTENEITAESDALATFDNDVEAEFGNSLTPQVLFSDSLVNFSTSSHGAGAGVSDARYVQVSLLGQNAYDMPTWLVRLLGWDTLPVGVSATAGPIASTSCKLEPLIVCGDPDAGCADPDVSCYGFDRTQYRQGDASNPPEECYLKGCSGNQNCNTGNTVAGGCGVQGGGAVGGINGDIGPGNFYTARLGCNGANCLRDAFKDSTANACIDPGDTVETEPGNMVGPMKQAYNTKFGDYDGPVNPTEWPADEVVSETISGETMFYDDYVLAPQDNFGANTVPNKRVMNIIVADCSGKNNGQSTLTVLTTACFFGTQKVTSDAGGNDIVVWGQFVSGRACGGDSISLNNTIDTQKIILYKDPDTVDS